MKWTLVILAWLLIGASVVLAETFESYAEGYSSSSFVTAVGTFTSSESLTIEAGGGTKFLTTGGYVPGDSWGLGMASIAWELPAEVGGVSFDLFYYRPSASSTLIAELSRGGAVVAGAQLPPLKVDRFTSGQIAIEGVTFDRVELLAGAGVGVGIDNLATTIPEPSIGVAAAVAVVAAATLRRAKRRDKCVQCDAPALDGQVRCEKHRAAMAQYAIDRQRRLKSEGRCVQCGRAAVAGMVLCETHRAEARKENQ